MSKLNSLLMGRFKSHAKKEKIGELVERSSTSPNPFQVSPISPEEKKGLESLLHRYQKKESNLSEDLNFLSAITSEVKAINNQAVILHGERIKKAQELFKKYREGAFTNWLLKTYGNRQTPYNFLQYYELYKTLPKNLQGVVDEMPRQAIYSLSSRNVPQEEKIAFVKAYNGESKIKLLEKLRSSFPLPQKDKRNPNKTKQVLTFLSSTKQLIQDDHFVPTRMEQEKIITLIQEIKALLKS